MSVYSLLNVNFTEDVSELRKVLVKKILDEKDVPESYELLSFFSAGSTHISKHFEGVFIQAIYRIKSALPTSTTQEILGDLMSEIVERESQWADGWEKYFVKQKAKLKYEKASKAFSGYLTQTG